MINGVKRTEEPFRHTVTKGNCHHNYHDSDEFVNVEKKSSSPK